MSSMRKTERNVRPAQLEDRDARDLLRGLCDGVRALAGRDARFDQHAVRGGVVHVMVLNCVGHRTICAASGDMKRSCDSQCGSSLR